ncbi:hypothetical protein HNP24_003998 [Chryseobacterium sediminis]|uniref:Uncharacterized protein n=1 Tax=Chryseobacterium sediminis TaxID=1679494 RepID=A0ABR6Q4V4_9FLAO|nr:hypothetical protein [Chryseobacterium sediminis]MBB6332995.1 hypothetical protein [Chryseobacterium sediminis]
MKDKIKTVISKYSSRILDCENIFVVDFKNINGGEIECFCDKPEVDAVYINNPSNIESCFILFDDNCLEISTGVCSKQCECIAFPTENHPKSWILCIETKYSHSHENAFREENNYPYIMIEKIKETVAYFRKRGVIEEKKQVTGIVSFPKLIEDFSESFKPKGESIEDILIEHNILIRPTNNLKIKGVKRIVFE